MAYVGGGGATSGCIFCNAHAACDDPKYFVLHRAPLAFLILNLYPYAPGHVMAVLIRHVGTVAEATPEELGALMRLVGLATTALEAEYRANGFNIGINQGRLAGAGMEDHLHVHVVPRWAGDTNFMPVVGEVRVLPEALPVTYNRLRYRLGG
jgi:ATP adenylyltransferase